MTRDEFLAASERRYWLEQLCCYRSRMEIAQAVGCHRSLLSKRFRALDIPARGPYIRPPPGDRLCNADLQLTLVAFLRDREREYFRELMAQGLGATAIGAIANLHRSAVYKRMRTVGISSDESHRLSGRKRQGGNAAWRSLADSPEPRAQASR